jgi:hypothetical protein
MAEKKSAGVVMESSMVKISGKILKIDLCVKYKFFRYGLGFA